MDLPARRSRPARLAAFLAGIVLACSMAGTGARAQAQDPKPVRVIVPFAAGSYTDNVVRIVMPALGERLRATIVVENRPGANGVIGADAVAKSAMSTWT